MCIDSFCGGCFQDVNAFGKVGDGYVVCVPAFCCDTLALKVVDLNRLEVFICVDMDGFRGGIRVDVGNVVACPFIDVHSPEGNHAVQCGREAVSGGIEYYLVGGVVQADVAAGNAVTTGIVDFQMIASIFRKGYLKFTDGVVGEISR